MRTQNHHNKHSITYGRKKIEYSLLYCDRTTMEIAVHPNRTIVVKVPAQSNIELIEKKIIKRARWIIRQLNYFNQFNPRTPERCYVKGESHLYLGKQYRLKLKKGDTDNVKLTRGYFHVTSINTPTPEIAKRLLNQWYLNKAQIQFADSMDRCWQKFSYSEVDKPIIAIKRMKKRWGSFSDKRTVTLNIELIKAPKECINYVILHELCHMKYCDHSTDFYNLLNSVIPGWEKIKHKLELSMM